jgi:hypothetical protein
MAVQAGNRGRRVLGPGRDRDRHGEHVVDQQGAGHRDPRLGPQVDRGDLVITTPGGVGVHVLPVGRDHDQHHERDPETDERRGHVRRRARQGKGQEHLVRGVGHRRQRVGGEHRQRDPLGQQRLPEALAVNGAADQEALERIGERGHERPS